MFIEYISFISKYYEYTYNICIMYTLRINVNIQNGIWKANDFIMTHQRKKSICTHTIDRTVLDESLHFV